MGGFLGLSEAVLVGLGGPKGASFWKAAPGIFVCITMFLLFVDPRRLDPVPAGNNEI